jgi:SHO1 osmosensor
VGSIGQPNAGGFNPHSNLMGGAADPGADGGVGNLSDDPAQQAGNYPYKARALFSCASGKPICPPRVFADVFARVDEASVDDPSETSFTKGEILDIVDLDGKWWTARKADGSTGSVFTLSCGRFFRHR